MHYLKLYFCRFEKYTSSILLQLRVLETEGNRVCGLNIWGTEFLVLQHYIERGDFGGVA